MSGKVSPADLYGSSDSNDDSIPNQTSQSSAPTSAPSQEPPEPPSSDPPEPPSTDPPETDPLPPDPRAPTPDPPHSANIPATDLATAPASAPATAAPFAEEQTNVASGSASASEGFTNKLHELVHAKNSGEANKDPDEVVWTDAARTDVEWTDVTQVDAGETNRGFVADEDVGQSGNDGPW